MMTFRHAGDRGDILASLPVVRHFGGGVFYIEPAVYTRVMLTPDKWNGLDLLLREQPYIHDVLPLPNPNFRVSINLNDFRPHLSRAMKMRSCMDKSLMDWACDAHSVPLTARDTEWLQVATPNRVSRIILNRTGPGRPKHYMYHNPQFPWRRVWDKYHKDMTFIGSPEEHKIFSAVYGEVPYYPTANLLEAAQVIAGADLFIGNQSVCLWIAEGMKKNIILEVWPQGPNSLSHRSNFIQGWDHNVILPDLWKE